MVFHILRSSVQEAVRLTNWTVLLALMGDTTSSWASRGSRFGDVWPGPLSGNSVVYRAHINVKLAAKPSLGSPGGHVEPFTAAAHRFLVVSGSPWDQPELAGKTVRKPGPSSESWPMLRDK
ncbi:hypothetical protein K0M31_010552 [Melipona bicolor]|uniref:Uncharacterized protein n=1 Tax=Melipona bicolor TaxID=60889 RepID=A0AA40FLG9_9HYME|nr:hypothetical protein K0M31_010552 [Melipona bicolor]